MGERLRTLHEACEKGDLEAVKKAASDIENIDCRNDRGWNALIMAAFNQHLPVVRFLVERCQADVNATNPKGTTVFMYAKTAVVESHDTRLLEYLVEHGAYINARDGTGKTVLDYVAENPAGEWLAGWLERQGAVRSAAPRQ